MKCFSHQHEDAVGVCRSCLKGLCSNCAVDIGEGIACLNSCEKRAKDIVNVLQASVGAQQDFKRRGVYMFPIFSISLGVVFLVSALYSGKALSFISASGVIFTLFGLVILWLNRKHAKRIT